MHDDMNIENLTPEELESMNDEELNEIFNEFVLRPIAEAAGIYMEPEEILARIDEEEKNPSVINPDKMLQLQAAHKILKQVGKRTGAKVTYEVNKPFISIGSVTIEGNNIGFSDPKLLIKLSRLASNMDAYVRSDGTTVIDFTFHGLTRMIKKRGGSNYETN